MREPEVIDLRPSMWAAHGWVMGCVLALAFGFVIATWPDADAIERAALILLSLAVALVALVATALVAVFRRGRAPLLAAYATTIAVVAALIAALAGAP